MKPLRSREPAGVVYTPRDVARTMVELALAPLVAARTTDEIAELRICDPAIGEGVFLAEVVEFLSAYVPREHVIAHCIYGVDIDARAVAAARATLDTPHLRVGNALALDWRGEFGIDGFDVVIGNPPYIRQELLADKTALRAFASFDGVADLYVYFIELAHRIARRGGRYCFITPNKWLTVAYGRALRAFLAVEQSVEGVLDLAGVRLFEEDAFPCIVWGTVGGPQGAIEAARVESRDAIASTPRIAHERASWGADPWHIDDPADRALIEELERRWPTLGDAVSGRPARGIVTGCNRVFVIDRPTRDRLIAAEPAATAIIRPFIKGRDIRPYVPEPADRYILLVDRGTSVDAFPHVLAYLEQFRAELEPKLERGDGPGRKPGSYRWYELQDPVGELSASRAPRLFYQDIQTAPACCLDETGLVPDTTVWVLPSSDRYLLALLNSPLYHWYARRRFPPALNGAVRPKLEYIRALPIATPSAQARAQIETLVDRRLAGERVDRGIADAVADIYELSAADRQLIGNSTISLP